jgi:hypothetical protein
MDIYLTQMDYDPGASDHRPAVWWSFSWPFHFFSRMNSGKTSIRTSPLLPSNYFSFCGPSCGEAKLSLSLVGPSGEQDANKLEV